MNPYRGQGHGGGRGGRGGRGQLPHHGGGGLQQAAPHNIPRNVPHTPQPQPPQNIPQQPPQSIPPQNIPQQPKLLAPSIPRQRHLQEPQMQGAGYNVSYEYDPATSFGSIPQWHAASIFVDINSDVNPSRARSVVIVHKNLLPAVSTHPSSGGEHTIYHQYTSTLWEHIDLCSG